MENVKTVQAIWEQGVELPLHVTVDEGAIQRYLLGIAAELEQAPRDAEEERHEDADERGRQDQHGERGVERDAEEDERCVRVAGLPLRPRQPADRTMDAHA